MNLVIVILLLNLFIHNFNEVKMFIIGMHRVTKENRTAGILDNFAEGERYAEHAVRKFVRNKSSEIMPSVNSFFSDPK